MVRSKCLLCLLAIFIAGVHAGAQQITGSIRGTVQDPSSAFVQSASVSAQQAETGLKRTAMTDPSGGYVLLELPVGHYELRVEAKGFQKYIQQGITLNVNQTAIIPIHLAVGAESQVLEVIADAQLIQGTVTSLGKTVSEREVLDLPLNGRNFTQLGLLQPGVVPLTPGLAEAGGSLRAGQAYAVNGQRPESNNFLIDGANNFNGVDGGFVLKPPVDAITEFRILTHNASAEFGQSLGSTTNIITRSGTNRFHGALWEFLRNDVFDATNYFAATTEPLKQNQFGGTFGGPIRKDKTFFFAYFEGFRNRQGETDSSTVPSVAERQGDFSQSLNGSGGLRMIYDPLSTQTSADGKTITRTPFAGNRIPQSALDPIAVSYTAKLWKPNAPGIGPYHLRNYYAPLPIKFQARSPWITPRARAEIKVA